MTNQPEWALIEGEIRRCEDELGKALHNAPRAGDIAPNLASARAQHFHLRILFLERLSAVDAVAYLRSEAADAIAGLVNP